MDQPQSRPLQAVTLPWLVLVTPGAAWPDIARLNPWLWAVTGHWALVLAGSVIAYGSTQELLMTAGFAGHSVPLRTATVVMLAFTSLLLVFTGLGAAALTGLGLIRILGHDLAFRRLFTWTGYALLPVSIGNLLGKTIFAIVRPLAENPATAFAYLIRPFSPGVNGFLSTVLPALSFGWFLAAYLDIFTIWSLWLVFRGADSFISLNRGQKLCLIAALMIVFFAVITGLWNLTQFALLKFPG